MKTTQFWMRLALYFILLVATGLMFFLPGGPHFQSLVTDTIHYERAKVTAVLSEQLEPSGIEPTQQLGQQLLEVALQSGETIELTNYLTDVHNIPVSEGQRVIVCVDAPENVEPYYTLYNFDRSGAVAGIVLIFIALMVLIGRRRGFDAALALLFSVLFLTGDHSSDLQWRLACGSGTSHGVCGNSGDHSADVWISFARNHGHRRDPGRGVCGLPVFPAVFPHASHQWISDGRSGRAAGSGAEHRA